MDWQPRIVYRILRKISDWTLTGFYTEVCVEAHPDFPCDGPLIIAATHHNEIIDIATLTATIPYRRPVSFWAKSTMFKNPLVGAILTSSGAIPVKRNLNKSAEETTAKTTASSESLFASSSKALSQGAVVGIFPEGTSYTAPGIIQVKAGAAWTAVEFANTNSGKDVKIVPVGIVYTDKSRYRSRVYVRYGAPIGLTEFKEQYESEKETDAALVKRLTNAIEKQMKALVIDAEDWNTVYSARLARSMIWHDDSNLHLKDWVPVSQLLTDMLSEPAKHAVQNPCASILTNAKAALIKYHSLLHYTGTTHGEIRTLYPRNAVPATGKAAKVFAYRATLLLLKVYLKVYFAWYMYTGPLTGRIPFPALDSLVLIPHIPAYVAASLAVATLATRGEEEGIAQYKVIFGGIGRLVGILSAASVVKRWFTRVLIIRYDNYLNWELLKTTTKLADVLRGDHGRLKGWISNAVFLFVVGHSVTGLYSWFFDDFYKELKRYKVSWTILSGFLSSPAQDSSMYEKPPQLKRNQFLDKKEEAPQDDTPIFIPPIARRKLIHQLLHARVEASNALARYVGQPEVQELYLSKNQHLQSMVSYKNDVSRGTKRFFYDNVYICVGCVLVFGPHIEKFVRSKFV